MSKVRLKGIAAVLMCLTATAQVAAWIGGAPGGQAFFACLAAFYAVMLWQKEKELDEWLSCGPNVGANRAAHEIPR